MRQEIVEFPERGVSIYRGSFGICKVTLCKDPQNEVVDGETKLTANVETMDVPYFDTLQAEMESDFEANFEKARLIGLQKAKDTIYEQIKSELATSDYKDNKHYEGALSDEEFEIIKVERSALRAKYNAVEIASTREEIEAIMNNA